MQHYSYLDLAPIPEGQTAAQALKATVDLAQAAEKAGFHRYWLAEHHNMPGIASAATPVVIGHIAGHTKTMRIGGWGHHAAEPLPPRRGRAVRHPSEPLPEPH